MGKNKISSQEIIKKQLARVKLQNPSYSMRALARDLNISASYLSAVLNGNKQFPPKRLGALAKALQMDDVSSEMLAKELDAEFILKHKLSKAGTAPTENLETYTELPAKSFQYMDKWYYIAILDLAACRDFSADPDFVGTRLGISTKEAAQAIRDLKADKWLIEDANGNLKKAHARLRFPTNISREKIRGFHAQMIKLALKELVEKTGDVDFEQRLITGLTFSANIENLPKARLRLHEALYEIAEILTEGECTEVFQLNTQLFKLTT